MKTTLVCTRRYNKEDYKFFLNEPEYVGEKGILGVEIEPYITVETPENAFGYTDTIMMRQGVVYSLNRYFPKWILNRVGKKIQEIMAGLEYGGIL